MIRVNLAPPVVRPRRVRPRFVGALVGLAYVVMVLGLSGAFAILAGTEQQLLGEIDGAQRELASIRTTLGRGARVREDLAELARRIQAIQDLTKNQAAAILVMDAFADVIPRDLWITTLEGRGTELRAMGSAHSPTAVADFMSNLRASGKFREVEIVVSKQDLAKTPSVVTFEVTCRFGT